MVFNIIPNNSVNNVPFGCSKDTVRKNFKIVNQVTEDKLSTVIKTHDDGTGFQFWYDDNMNFHSIKIEPRKNNTILLNEIKIPFKLKKVVNFMKNNDSNIMEGISYYLSLKLGMCVMYYQNTTKIEHIMFFKNDKKGELI